MRTLLFVSNYKIHSPNWWAFAEGELVDLDDHKIKFPKWEFVENELGNYAVKTSYGTYYLIKEKNENDTNLLNKN